MTNKKMPNEITQEQAVKATPRRGEICPKCGRRTLKLDSHICWDKRKYEYCQEWQKITIEEAEMFLIAKGLFDFLYCPWCGKELPCAK